MREPIYHPWRVLGADWPHIAVEHRTDLAADRLGEYLIIPTRVVSIESAEDAGFFDGINERLGDI